MSLADFISQGRASFGDASFEAIKYALEAIDIGVEFLVTGFEGRGNGSIFSIDDRCIPKFHQKLGFYAIGSGNIGAMGSLYNSMPRLCSIEETIYRLCEAKFIAESAPGVGKTTIAQILYSDGIGPLFIEEQLLPIRKVWERKGRPKLSKAAFNAARTSLELGKSLFEDLQRKK
jgi:hypothetical protein